MPPDVSDVGVAAGEAFAPPRRHAAFVTTDPAGRKGS